MSSRPGGALVRAAGARNPRRSRFWLRRDGEPALLLQSARRIAVAVVALAATLIPVVAATPLRIVVLGDSLSAGYQLPRTAAFPDVLQQRLKASGRDVVITNAGVSGDTAADGLARMDWSIPDDTDLVIVELGGNDMLRGIDPSETVKTLDTICARIKARGIGLVIAGMHAIDNYGPQYRQRFDAIYPQLAAKYDAPLYPFFMQGIYENVGNLLPDHLHPNPSGVVAMVDGFLPFITPVIDDYLKRPRKA